MSAHCDDELELDFLIESEAQADAGTSPPARMWQMIRLAAGDYLLPSNDRSTVFRIRRYEDGPSYGVEKMKRDETYWGCWRWMGRPDRLDDIAVDYFPEGWATVEEYLPTRQAGIDVAMCWETDQLLSKGQQHG